MTLNVILVMICKVVVVQAKTRPAALPKMIVVRAEEPCGKSSQGADLLLKEARGLIRGFLFSETSKVLRLSTEGLRVSKVCPIPRHAAKSRWSLRPVVISRFRP